MKSLYHFVAFNDKDSCVPRYLLSSFVLESTTQSAAAELQGGDERSSPPLPSRSGLHRNNASGRACFAEPTGV